MFHLQIVDYLGHVLGESNSWALARRLRDDYRAQGIRCHILFR